MAAPAPNSAPPKGPPAPAGPQQHRQQSRELRREGDHRSRPEEDREAEVRSVRRVLKAAGVRDAEQHARRLVEIREWEGVDDYTPPTIQHLGSSAAARDQLSMLKERLAEVQSRRLERASRGLMGTPRTADLDAAWARRVRQADPDRFRQLDGDVAVARQRLAEAKLRGDMREISGLQTAVDITTHQVQRAELGLRTGEQWELLRRAHELAPHLLAELEEREQRTLPAQEAALRSALDASDLRRAPPTPRPDPHPEPELAHAAP